MSHHDFVNENLFNFIIIVFSIFNVVMRHNNKRSLICWLLSLNNLLKCLQLTYNTFVEYHGICCHVWLLKAKKTIHYLEITFYTDYIIQNKYNSLNKLIPNQINSKDVQSTTKHHSKMKYPYAWKKLKLIEHQWSFHLNWTT